MFQKELLIRHRIEIPVENPGLSSTGTKYFFQFIHIEQGIFLLTSKGYADEKSIREQIRTGDKIRAQLNQHSPDTPFHLIWDISELRGASLLARYKMLRQVAPSGKYGTITLVGSNNFAKSHIKLLSSLVPHLKFFFCKTSEEAINQTKKRINILHEKSAGNCIITPETESFARFIDLWQKQPEYFETDFHRMKILKSDKWSYISPESIIEISIIEGNIVFVRCEGFIMAPAIEKLYKSIEDFMSFFGFTHPQNRFYVIVDLKKARGITLKARKMANYYDELYKERVNLVIMLSSPPLLHFILKIQRKINKESFNEWVECSSMNESFEMISRHKEGQLSFDHFNTPERKLLKIPDSKAELEILVEKLYLENMQLKDEQNEHIQRILEMTGRMTWDETFTSKLDFHPENYGAFTDIYNALFVVQDDFKEIIREKLEETRKLKESEDKYRNLINLANDIIAVFQDGVCKLVNSRVKDMTGYLPDQVTNISPRKFITPEELKKISGAVHSLKNGTPGYFETFLTHKDGRKIPVSVSVGSIIYENRPARMYIVRDITARRKAEEELESYRNRLEIMVDERTRQLEREIMERESAEKSDRLKSAFLSNMSHEIRTPMNAIIAFSNFLRNPGISQQQREEYINYIQSSGESLLNLINDIIDISKIEARQIDIRMMNCRIGPILDELHTLFEDIRKSKGNASLQIVLEKNAHGKNLILNTDPYRLKQILSNLLHNAIKFTEKGFVGFGYEIRNGYVEFFVKDTGIGIPPNMVDQIFKRFGKLESSGKNNGGTGLGLAISKNLAILLGGELTVESSPGEGSTFFLRLPHRMNQHDNSENTRPEYTEKKVYNWENRKILVAEDEDLNFKVIQIALEHTKAEIIRARDGYEALDAIESIPEIDIVLMDIQMPNLDGYKALVKIKQLNSNLPVIAQTAYAMIEEQEKCLKKGFNDYIAKPIRIPELMMKMDKLMN